MTARTFDYRESEGIARITLARPDKLNALTYDVYNELRDTFRDLAGREEIRVVIVTGQGRGFCSGGDVNEIIGDLLHRNPTELLQFTRLTGDLVRQMCRLPKPIIAAINGTCAGAGAMIALASDFRIAAQSAKIAFLFTRVGLAGADMGAAYLLPRIVGLGEAARLLYLGESIPAEEAHRIRLVHDVVPDEQVQAAADAMAKQLVSGPALAYAATKAQLYAELSMTLDQAIEAEAQVQARLMESEDFRECFNAFREKRQPKFKGK